MLPRTGFAMLWVLILASGCIELQAILSGILPHTDATPGDGGQDEPPDSDATDGDDFAVGLSASNPTPQVNEEVFLTCGVTRGDADGVVFDFQPANSRLAVDGRGSVASFIIQETDVGQSFTFTCSGRNGLGETATSFPQTISPSM